MAIPTTRVQQFFHLFFLSTTSKKSFIPDKASADVQALNVCPVRPRVLSRRFVQFGQESCQEGLSTSAKSLVQLEKTFITQSSCGCLKKCLQLSILLPLPFHKLHTYPKIHKKKKKEAGK